jgi:hypothetical protein
VGRDDSRGDDPGQGREAAVAGTGRGAAAVVGSTGSSGQLEQRDATGAAAGGLAATATGVDRDSAASAGDTEGEGDGGAVECEHFPVWSGSAGRRQTLHDHQCQYRWRRADDSSGERLLCPGAVQGDE